MRFWKTENDSTAASNMDAQNQINLAPSDSKTTQKKTEGLKCEGQVGPCDRMDATRQRQNTAYVDDDLNWVTLCPECMESNEQFWKDRWEEVHGRIL